MKGNTICVCGAGTMGSGIAQVAATAGFTTILYEVNAAILEQAKSRLEAGLQRLVQKQKITTNDKQTILQHIRFTDDIQQCRADIVIEAIVEKMEAKLSLLQSLAAINTHRTILASNTSSLSITEIAKHIHHPERIAGLHFFNPAPVMKLVEIVRGQQTSDDTITILVNLVEQLEKTPVVCSDSPGFIVNRVARPYYIEALRLAEEGVSFETIDKLLEAQGFKMGPFKLMDLIGNDINYAVSCSVYEQLHQPERLQPSYLQQQKVTANELGKKTGKGYYTYTPNS